MTARTFLDAARLRTARALSSARGAFDLPSIITGVVVVAILAGGVFAAVFGVIPFAQDHGAKQDLAAVRTAEGVAKAKDGAYVSGVNLDSSGYLSARTGLAIGADETGSCWVGFAKSGAGTVFYATDAVRDPKTYTAGTDTGCLSAEAQAELFAATGASPASEAVPGAGMPAAPVGYAASWGSNSYGQIGDDTITSTTVPVAPLATPAALAGKTVSSVESGTFHTCALADGAVYCWGSNSNGQLGNGKTTSASVPVSVSTDGALAGKHVTAISIGQSNTCALADGAVYCWGSNYSGALGNGTGVDSSVPFPVSTAGVLNGKTVDAIASGSFSTCATSEGKAYCWGNNNYGQLGNGTTATSTTPSAVKGLTGTTSALAMGVGHACALADGKPYCWGYNWNGQLGNGTVSGNTNPNPTPSAVVTTGALKDKTVTALSGSSGHTCAIASGKAYCWGVNSNGQLGNGSLVMTGYPVAVDGTGKMLTGPVTAVTAKSSHSCAIAGGSAYCWGSNWDGQLGNGSFLQTSGETRPVAVKASGDLAGKVPTQITGENNSTCTVASGSVYCWGNNSSGRLGTGDATRHLEPRAVLNSSPLAGKQVSDLSAGYFSQCAVADGVLACWGRNNNGQLGNSSTNDARVPITVGGALSGKTVSTVGVGYYQACAVADGAAYCWGLNDKGQLGDGSKTQSEDPVAAVGAMAGKSVTSVATGINSSCAIADGRAYCWGSNASGLLGTGAGVESLVPVAVAGPLADKTVTSISVGQNHACAVADATVYCWGQNMYGQLGTGTTTGSTLPVTLDGLEGKTVTSIEAGSVHTCAAADGAAYCWGYNQSAQIGNNTTGGNVLSPAAVSAGGVLGGKIVTSVSAGVDHSCAVADGAGFCWGKNNASQLGDGTTDSSMVPVAVKDTGSLEGKTVVQMSAGWSHTAVLYR